MLAILWGPGGGSLPWPPVSPALVSCCLSGVWSPVQVAVWPFACLFGVVWTLPLRLRWFLLSGGRPIGPGVGGAFHLFCLPVGCLLSHLGLLSPIWDFGLLCSCLCLLWLRAWLQVWGCHTGSCGVLHGCSVHLSPYSCFGRPLP